MPKENHSIRRRGFQREKQEQAFHALSWSPDERVERAGELYLEMANMLPVEAVQRDMERRLQEKAASRLGFAKVRESE